MIRNIAGGRLIGLIVCPTSPWKINMRLLKRDHVNRKWIIFQTINFHGICEFSGRKYQGSYTSQVVITWISFIKQKYNWICSPSIKWIFPTGVVKGGRIVACIYVDMFTSTYLHIYNSWTDQGYTLPSAWFYATKPTISPEPEKSVDKQVAKK